MKRLPVRKKVGWYVVIGIFLIFTLFPIYWMFVTSLKSFQETYTVIPTFWPEKAQWSNYTDIFRKYNYGSALVNSIRVSLTVSVISVGVSIFAAYSVVRLRFLGRKMMPRVFLMSYLIPRTILFIPIFIFLANLGLTNSIGGLLLVYPTITIPYATWVLIAAFQQLPVELEESARVDGANRLQTIIRIVIPPSMPAIISTFIFAFTLCWSEYIYALVIINSKMERTITLALSTMLVADIIPWGPLMAGAVIAALPIMLVYLFGSRFIVSGLTLGSVKG
jgi:multiple sugar transport system permease protein